MRILVCEALQGDSDEVERDALSRGHEVVRCQPANGQVRPCIGLVGDAGCPLDERVDVAIDVHPGAGGLSMREIGLLCAERAGIPMVAVGNSPIGALATETGVDSAVDEAERLVRDTDGRPPTYVVERAARSELASLGHPDHPVWVSYDEHDGVFDVEIEAADLGPIEIAAIDAAVLPMFVDAMRQRRFGDVVYRQHAPTAPGR